MQRDGLAHLGVEPSRIYVDHGLTGTNRDRPGLREALGACRAGDSLVVTNLDRLTRSLPDARAVYRTLQPGKRAALASAKTGAASAQRAKQAGHRTQPATPDMAAADGALGYQPRHGASQFPPIRRLPRSAPRPQPRPQPTPQTGR